MYEGTGRVGGRGGEGGGGREAGGREGGRMRSPCIAREI